MVMIINSVSREMAHQVSDKEQRQILQNHFNLLYILLAENQLIPEAVFETKNGIKRCLSGIPVPFHNAVMGSPEKSQWDQTIKEQFTYFSAAKMPFVWYIDEESNPEFKEKLLAYGFQDNGIFKGVIGGLDNAIPSPTVPNNCVLERVKNESVMEAFNDLVCATFGIHGVSKDLYKKFLWESTQNKRHPMCHWLARKEGKVVSALSTLIEGNVVSFWNGASLPEIRRQGLSTALRCLALKEAISKGCRFGASYLMSEGLAFGICSKLGFQLKWRFNVFLSPSANKSH